jgi:hypothetical protein
MAMKEAAELFGKSGGAANGSQQDAVNSAGATCVWRTLCGLSLRLTPACSVMKLLMKQQMGSCVAVTAQPGLLADTRTV